MKTFRVIRRIVRGMRGEGWSIIEGGIRCKSDGFCPIVHVANGLCPTQPFKNGNYCSAARFIGIGNMEWLQDVVIAADTSEHITQDRQKLRRILLKAARL